MNDPDAELMLTFCGPRGRLRELYRRYRDRIVAFCRRIVGTDAQAEEAAQDVFIKLYRHARRHTPRAAASRAFIYRIAANHCLKPARACRAQARAARRRRRCAFCAAELTARAAPHAALEQASCGSTSRRALATLPDRQRTALVLVHYEGLATKKRPSGIDVTESALKSLIHRARTAMMRSSRFIQGRRGASKEHAHAV